MDDASSRARRVWMNRTGHTSVWKVHSEMMSVSRRPQTRGWQGWARSTRSTNRTGLGSEAAGLLSSATDHLHATTLRKARWTLLRQSRAQSVTHEPSRGRQRSLSLNRKEVIMWINLPLFSTRITPFHPRLFLPWIKSPSALLSRTPSPSRPYLRTSWKRREIFKSVRVVDHFSRAFGTSKEVRKPPGGYKLRQAKIPKICPMTGTMSLVRRTPMSVPSRSTRRRPFGLQVEDDEGSLERLLLQSLLSQFQGEKSCGRRSLLLRLAKSRASAQVGFRRRHREQDLHLKFKLASALGST